MELKVDIEKHWKSFTLNTSFTTQGGCTGILGASGCGKSMTLRAIAGIIKPSRGQILFGERIFFDSERKINLRVQNRNTGFLFQNYALFPNMTVEQNISAGLFGKDKKDKQKVQTVLRKFHLEGLEKHYPTMLSGGQQQRTALARIMVKNPDILLLDEPFSALDGYLKEELQAELKGMLQEFNGNAILVTHDRDEAYKLCDQLLIMDKGSVVTAGNTKELFQHPPNYQTAKLTGCKNLSKAERINAHKVYAKDWDIFFEVEREVPENLKYIGIRAHDFVPAGKEDRNQIPIKIHERMEGPFEESILLKMENGNRIWWKIEKTSRKVNEKETLSEYISISPDKIMLLK